MERPLTIAIICHPTLGGSGVVATDLGTALAERGHTVHIVSHRRPVRIASPHPRVRFHEVPVTRYPLFTYPPYTLALATKLAALCREERIDVLHAHYAIPHAVSAYLCRQMLGRGAPKIVTTLHGTDITLVGLDDSFYEITRFSLLESDGVTAVSNYLARQVRQRFKLESDVTTIYNFIDLERFSPSNRDGAVRSRFACGDEALVGHLSNFRWVKRVPDVVRVFQRIVLHVPACLVMIGDGPDLPAVKLVADELGVLDRIKFLGSEQDAAALLPALDLFLLPSEQESFGLAALEAMACGVPVIASNVGGLPELVTEGEAGHLFPVGAVTAMGEKAAGILADRTEHARLQAGARRRAEDFRQDGLVGQYEAFYRAVLPG